jgi:hypothetical protein
MVLDAKTRRHQELRRLYEAAVRDQNPGRFMSDFQESLRGDAADLATRWSLRQLFEQFVPDGREAANMLRPSSGGGYQIQESAELVDTSQFANIIGQIMYTATLQGFNQPGLIGDQLVEVIQTQFSGERIPGVGRLGDDLDIVNEGGEYPNAVLGEEYVDTPETIKRGLILNVTREAIYFDRTGVLMSECGRVGERVGVNREKRIIDVVTGISTVYRRNGAAAVATYAADNTVTNTLADWTSIDTVAQKFNALTDPVTGEPISIDIKTIVVPKALEMLANRIMTATMTRQATNTGNNQTYVNGNSVMGSPSVLTGQYVKQRTASDSTWFAGDPKAAFVYMQNWPLTVTQSDENSEVGFTRDIVARFKASERGAAGVRERLKMAKCT